MEQRRPHILQIVFRNTATLDTSLPLLWKIRKSMPMAKVSILYCVGDKRQILRDTDYFCNFAKESQIQQYDFSNFLRTDNPIVKKIWRKLFSASYYDGVSIKKFINKPHLIFTSKIKFLLRRFKRHIEYAIGRKLVDTENMLKQLKPDAILFDHRAKVEFYGKDHVFDYFEQHRIPILLLPHAPHDITPTSEFTPFDDSKESLPDYCQYWLSFQHAMPWLKVPEQKAQFKYVGYPGFEDEWLKHIKTANGEYRDRKMLRCMVMTRNFFPKDKVDGIENEWFILPYKTILNSLELIKNAFDQSDRDIELWIKPHPSSSEPRTIELIQTAGFRKWKVVYEPFYSLLPKVDFVISEFTTSILLPAMYGIPTIVLNSRLQEYVHQWEVLSQLYKGLRYFVEKPSEQLVEVVKSAIREIEQDKDMGVANPDAEHLQGFFPEGTFARGLSLISELTEKRA